MADDKVQFRREPYMVKYVDLTGNVQSIQRTPPPKLHDALPQDMVELTHKKNADFDTGDKLEVTGISPRQPNVLQVKNADGQVTFIDYFDMKLREKIVPETGRQSIPGVPTSDSSPGWATDNRYLIWP